MNGCSNFFVEHYKPRAVGLMRSTDAIGQAIQEAQRAVTGNKKPSLWSHCFIFGELRFDRRGPGNARSQSPYIIESDLKIKLCKPQLRNRAMQDRIGKWCGTMVGNAPLIDFGLSDDQKNDALATALQLGDEQALYPVPEPLLNYTKSAMLLYGKADFSTTLNYSEGRGPGFFL